MHSHVHGYIGKRRQCCSLMLCSAIRWLASINKEHLVGILPWESCIRGLHHCCALQAPSVSMAVPRCAMCRGDAVPWHVNSRNKLDVINIMA